MSYRFFVIRVWVKIRIFLLFYPFRRKIPLIGRRDYYDSTAVVLGLYLNRSTKNSKDVMHFAKELYEARMTRNLLGCEKSAES